MDFFLSVLASSKCISESNFSISDFLTLASNATTNSILFREAKEYIPGGVNSPVRAFNGVGGDPVFFDRGEGAYLFDVDGNSYIDYVGSWGPMILVHSNPVIIDAVKSVLDKGLGFGAPTAIETSLAKKVCNSC